ncbi:MAG: hypothetical protein RDU20_03430 [Desulfomonilaceae bacterium]|nr:hypothetical protein [Desulfomonilaceae bacterium]
MWDLVVVCAIVFGALVILTLRLANLFRADRGDGACGCSGNCGTCACSIGEIDGAAEGSQDTASRPKARVNKA